MPPLRFRAWHEGKMYKDVGLCTDGTPYIDADATTDDFREYLRSGIVMQSTGLKDKNGMEVFEGDIVRFKWNPIFNEPSEVFEYALPVEYDTVWGCFVVRIKGSDEEVKVAVGTPAEVGQDIEVIGNIHENPDLL